MTPTADDPAPDGTPRPTPPRPAPTPLDHARRALKTLASLRLTVVLFALSIGLVFLGTLAQMEYGIWTVVDQYFWSWYVMVPFDLFRQFMSVFLTEWFPKDGSRWTATFPFPSGKLLGGLMLANLLAAHAVRFRLTWKRSGVLLIHSGLILLFIGEFVTREFAVEQRMNIRQGSTVNYTEDSRHMELAFVDPSDEKEDKVVVVPERLLRSGHGKISDPNLPVDVEVLDYFTNAGLEPVKAATKSNRATEGVGKGVVALKRPDISGVDPNQKIDFPAAYVRLTEKATGRELGTYLASLQVTMMGGHDDVVAGGKTYQMNLRNIRYYKPYSVHLVEFRFDRYPGTQKAKNFSSEVVLTDPTAGEERRQLIKMNDPLRSHGETFYQSGFDPDEGGTTLQVVKNPGWLIPYISCVVVGVGMLLHFGIHLTSFLRRKQDQQSAKAMSFGFFVLGLLFGVLVFFRPRVQQAPDQEAAPTDVPPTGTIHRWLPRLCLAVVVVYAASLYGRMAPPRKPFNLDAFAQLPVLDGGRVKPLDSAARVYLRYVSGQSVFTDAAGVERPAIQWYLETLGSDPADENQAVWNYRVFRIDNEQVLSQLKFQPREGLRYSLNELRKEGRLKLVEAKGIAAVRKKRDGKKLDLEETKWFDLLDRLSLVRRLADGFGNDSQDNKFHLLPPQAAGQGWASLGDVRPVSRDEPAEIAQTETFAELLTAAREALKARPGGFGPAEEASLISQFQVPPDRRQAVLDLLFRDDPKSVPEDLRDPVLGAMLADLPPVERQAISARERPTFTARLAAAKKAQEDALAARLAANPAANLWDKMIRARLENRPDEFNKLLDEYQEQCLHHITGREVGKAKLETAYNRFAPFMQCTALYIIVFVLSALGFVLRAAEKPAWGEALRRSASWVLYATLILHTGALLVRMSLMDRPLVFVTNLYSSAVFIGWGCVMLGMVLEKLYPIGIGNAVAGILGLATTIVAHNLATDDTLEMMQAVLDTNFWLATHVTTVTLGYTATFVAGFLGAVYVLLVLAAVVKDGFLNPQPASVGALMSFGAAAAGVVGIPLFLLWFVSTALVAKFEWVHSSIPMVLLVVTAGAAAFYAGGLMMLKAGDTTAAAHGNSDRTGQVPAPARLVAGMALTPETSKVLGQMIYGVVCFATLLSFVGTVLGGIWADQSWGRFWGWDPKENGAVLIVLWNSLILHARWCGMVKDRGVAVLALGGNMICAWSWFGTNQLGIGLHAYGFDTRLADGCTNFWLSQLVIMGLGLIPRDYWASESQPRRRPEPPSGGEPGATTLPESSLPPSPTVKGKKGKKR